jgi:hypothetical protein
MANQYGKLPKRIENRISALYNAIVRVLDEECLKDEIYGMRIAKAVVEKLVADGYTDEPYGEGEYARRPVEAA